jgi:hypothetical protein
MWFYDEVFQLIQEKGKLNCRRVAQRKKKQSTVASTEVAMVPCKEQNNIMSAENISLSPCTAPSGILHRLSLLPPKRESHSAKASPFL